MTIERIVVVHAHVTRALVETSERTTLPELEQDQLLAQCCAETCDLLEDWLASEWWDRLRPAADGMISEFVPSQEHYLKLLDPVLKEALARAGRHGMSVPTSRVDEARAAVAATARRHRRMRRQQLYQAAQVRVGDLRRDVCKLAGYLKTRAQAATVPSAAGHASRRKARVALTKVSGLLMALALAMAGAGPQQMTHNLSDWEHEAVKMIMVHDIAHSAQPGLPVVPPRAGPQPR